MPQCSRVTLGLGLGLGLANPNPDPNPDPNPNPSQAHHAPLLACDVAAGLARAHGQVVGARVHLRSDPGSSRVGLSTPCVRVAGARACGRACARVRVCACVG